MFQATLNIVSVEIPAEYLLNNCLKVESLGQCHFQVSLKVALKNK